MPFEFINNNSSEINHAARKRIRSHAALGKNVGKKIARPSRKNAQSLGFKITPSAPCRSKILRQLDDSETSKDPAVPGIHRQLGDGLSVLPIPKSSRNFTIRGKHVHNGCFRVVDINLHKAITFFSGPRFVPTLNNAMDEASNHGGVWIGLMFQDEACMC